MSYKTGVIQSPGCYRIPYPQSQNMPPNRSALGQHLSYLHTSNHPNHHRIPMNNVHTNQQQPQQQSPSIMNTLELQLQQIFRPSLINHAISPPPTGPSKGLLNGPGQNNCFLNCAVQVSLVPFTLSFTYLSDKTVPNATKYNIKSEKKTRKT